MRIVNSAGVVRAEYTYNAWGELLSASGPVCNLNPLRYRGYVYDDETGLYYLNSRYYDPANRRMLSPDDLSVLNASPTSLNDKNLYTYCDNNPVNRYDADGAFWAEIGAAVSVVAVIVAVGAIGVATGGIGIAALAGGGTAIVMTSTATTAINVASFAVGTAIVSATSSLVISYASKVKARSSHSSKGNSNAKSKDETDPYRREGQKKQGRENKSKSRRSNDFKPRNNRRDNKPAPPKHHTPGRDHRKYVR